MPISGINGSNNILIGNAQLRVEQNIISTAKIIGKKGNYRIVFNNKEAEWNGEPLILASSRSPYEAKIFKSLDGAMADVLRTGLKTAEVEMTE